jgi:hypothetical protein
VGSTSGQRRDTMRQGASVSTKQLTFAAADGRRLTFDTLGLSGYLVGLDDYHYLVAVLDGTGQNISDVALIHKSTPLVRISLTAMLADEGDLVQDAVNNLGGKYIEHCRSTLGRKPAVLSVAR